MSEALKSEPAGSRKFRGPVARLMPVLSPQKRAQAWSSEESLESEGPSAEAGTQHRSGEGPSAEAPHEVLADEENVVPSSASPFKVGLDYRYKRRKNHYDYKKRVPGIFEEPQSAEVT